MSPISYGISDPIRLISDNDLHIVNAIVGELTDRPENQRFAVDLKQTLGDFTRNISCA